jgi:hypothetical protein
LDGNKVVEITDCAATIGTESGARLIYTRKPIDQ